VVALVGAVASIVGFFFVRTAEGGDPQKGLNQGMFVSGGLMILGTVAAIYFLLPKGEIIVHDVLTNRSDPFTWVGVVMAVVSGLLAGIAVGMITEWYTATNRRPVETIVNASRTGHATTIIQGI